MGQNTEFGCWQVDDSTICYSEIYRYPILTTSRLDSFYIIITKTSEVLVQYFLLFSFLQYTHLSFFGTTAPYVVSMGKKIVFLSAQRPIIGEKW